MENQFSCFLNKELSKVYQITKRNPQLEASNNYLAYNYREKGMMKLKGLMNPRNFDALNPIQKLLFHNIPQFTFIKKQKQRKENENNNKILLAAWNNDQKEHNSLRLSITDKTRQQKGKNSTDQRGKQGSVPSDYWEIYQSSNSWSVN